MEIRRSQFVQQTAQMDHQNMGEGHVPQACKHASLVTIYKKETEHNVVITEVYLFFPQPAKYLLDPTEQTLKPHNNNNKIFKFHYPMYIEVRVQWTI